MPILQSFISKNAAILRILYSEDPTDMQPTEMVEFVSKITDLTDIRVCKSSGSPQEFSLKLTGSPQPNVSNVYQILN